MVSLLVCSMASFPVYAQVNVQDIIARSVEANKADWKVEPEYNYSERDTESGHTKTYDVLMILGSPYQRLTGVDGKPLSDQQKRISSVSSSRRLRNGATRRLRNGQSASPSMNARTSVITS